MDKREKDFHITINVLDSNFSKIGTFKCLGRDLPKILKTIHHKFGINTRDVKKQRKKVDADIDWLRRKD
jgi:hypothetical protein